MKNYFRKRLSKYISRSILTNPAQFLGRINKPFTIKRRKYTPQKRNKDFLIKPKQILT